jgi:hypothetical protein
MPRWVVFGFALALIACTTPTPQQGGTAQPRDEAAQTPPPSAPQTSGVAVPRAPQPRDEATLAPPAPPPSTPQPREEPVPRAGQPRDEAVQTPQPTAPQ